ncbi:MAG: undecaprenyl-diphosphate phosphatase [Armatimonadetes bacterium]|nr:undecaprenyl-diphosphate phosphatase [Armatimonadota bacterium]
MDWIQAIVYGVIQGLTEFLPVSSSGHLNLLPHVFHWSDPGAGFTAVIQLGTVVATFIYFWNDIKGAFVGWAGSFMGKTARIAPEARAGWATFYATLPIIVIGLTVKHFIKGEARSLTLTAWMLIAFAIVLAVAEKMGKRKRQLEDVKPVDGLVMGVWQAIALVPGGSRSGTSISGGLFQGFERDAAARLSFLMSIPAVTAAGLYELYDARHELVAAGVGQTVVATVVSFVVGWWAVSFLMKFVRTQPMYVFVVYRILLGVAILAFLQHPA